MSLMEEHGLSEEQMAEELGISRPYLNHIKNGRRDCSKSVAMSIRSRFGVDPSDFAARLAASSFAGSRESLIEQWRAEGIRTLVNLHVVNAMHASLLTIDPWNSDRLQPCSYDLSIEMAADEAGILLTPEDNSQGLVLNPGAVLTVRAKETLGLSPHILGRLEKTSQSLVEHDVIVDVGGRVHPGWQGKISFRVANPQTKEVLIGWDAALVGVRFEFLPVAPASTDEINAALLSETELQAEIQRDDEILREASARKRARLAVLASKGASLALVREDPESE